jgi:two-component system, LytTR family, sensor kinase
MAAHFFGVQYFFQEDPGDIAIDSTVHFLVLGLLGWGCFYVIKYIDLSKNPSLSSILNLFTAIFVCGFLWLGASYGMDSLLLKGNTEFWEFYDSFLMIRIFEGMLLFTILVSVLLLFKFQERINQSRVDEAELKTLVSETRIQALNSQINPHFLFNSLNSISAQTLSDPEKSREMLTGLSEYLRYTLETEKESLTAFDKDLENSMKYMDIEKIRFGERLDFTLNVEPSAHKFQVPRMLLQPLLENVIKHAVEKSVESINTELKVDSDADKFELTLSNDAPGTATDFSRIQKGNGIGLANLEERLVLNFGQKVKFKYGFEGNRFVVRIEIDKTDNESSDH